MEPVNYKLMAIALERVEGTVFEKFATAVLSDVIGENFVPLGGTHDGGADGFIDDPVSQCDTSQDVFVQISTQTDHRSKVRDTVRRLKEYDRVPTRLFYVTSQTIGAIDREEHILTKELDVFVVLRDSKWLTAKVNHSDATRQAFYTYLHPDLNFLEKFGGTRLIQDSPSIGNARTVCVFLSQEVDRRRGQGRLLDAVVDSLLLWALQDTNPDENTLMSRDDIAKRINEVFPISEIVNQRFIRRRLKALSSKKNATGREVRWYQKEDMFCLPFETRKKVQKENVDDETLRLSVSKSFERRAREVNPKVAHKSVAAIALLSIQKTFEARGMELAAFIENEEGTPEEYADLTISDQVDRSLASYQSPDDVAILKRTVMAVIRQALYESTDDERLYFGKLTRTYSLFLTLKTEPRVVEYFQKMSSQLTLFVGTDMLIRALSEHYLKSEDQMTCNLLSILQKAGSQLILAQSTLDEVCAHLRTTDTQFYDRYSGIEDGVDLVVAEHESRILIRAYFYARLKTVRGIQPPNRWQEFLGQICTYRDLKTSAGKDQIRRYLMEKFGLTYKARDDLATVTSQDEVQALADRIEDVRANRPRVLAENDALTVLAVYGIRRSQGEEKVNNPFGYRTWWLTQEVRVIRATKEIVRKYGSRYIIRPEFLLQYVAFAPSTEAVRRAYEKVFPSLLGIKLSNRMKDDDFNSLMKSAKEVGAVDDARARVMLAEFSDKLKSDLEREY